MTGEPNPISAGERLRVWGTTVLLYCAAVSIPILASAPRSRRLAKVMLAGSLAIPGMIIIFLVPGLAAAAAAVQLHYRMSRRAGSAPSPATPYALILLTVTAVVGGMLAGVLIWDE